MCKVEDAFKCFMGTKLDVLVCENFILYKNEQDPELIKTFKDNFELD